MSERINVIDVTRSGSECRPVVDPARGNGSFERRVLTGRVI